MPKPKVSRHLNRALHAKQFLKQFKELCSRRGLVGVLLTVILLVCLSVPLSAAILARPKIVSQSLADQMIAKCPTFAQKLSAHNGVQVADISIKRIGDLQCRMKFDQLKNRSNTLKIRNPVSLDFEIDRSLAEQYNTALERRHMPITLMNSQKSFKALSTLRESLYRITIKIAGLNLPSYGGNEVAFDFHDRVDRDTLPTPTTSNSLSLIGASASGHEQLRLIFDRTSNVIEIEILTDDGPLYISNSTVRSNARADDRLELNAPAFSSDQAHSDSAIESNAHHTKQLLSCSRNNVRDFTHPVPLRVNEEQTIRILVLRSSLLVPKVEKAKDMLSQSISDLVASLISTFPAPLDETSALQVVVEHRRLSFQVSLQEEKDLWAKVDGKYSFARPASSDRNRFVGQRLFEAISKQRTESGADLVLYSSLDGGSDCGVSSALGASRGAFFALIHSGYLECDAVGVYVHELAHLLGARHEVWTSGSGGSLGNHAFATEISTTKKRGWGSVGSQGAAYLVPLFSGSEQSCIIPPAQSYRIPSGIVFNNYATAKANLPAIAALSSNQESMPEIVDEICSSLPISATLSRRHTSNWAVKFDPGVFDRIISADGPTLDQLVQEIEKRKPPTIIVSGFADQKGELYSNFKISLQRADFVRDVIKSKLNGSYDPQIFACAYGSKFRSPQNIENASSYDPERSVEISLSEVR